MSLACVSLVRILFLKCIDPSAPFLSCTVSLWTESIKAGTSAPHGSPCSTEPAAYSRVPFPPSPMPSPQEALKRPVYAICSPQQLPLVGASRSHGESLTDTRAIQLLRNSRMPRTVPALIPLDLSLINTRFA